MQRYWPYALITAVPLTALAYDTLVADHDVALTSEFSPDRPLAVVDRKYCSTKTTKLVYRAPHDYKLASATVSRASDPPTDLFSVAGKFFSVTSPRIVTDSQTGAAVCTVRNDVFALFPHRFSVTDANGDQVMHVAGSTGFLGKQLTVTLPVSAKDSKSPMTTVPALRVRFSPFTSEMYFYAEDANGDDKSAPLVAYARRRWLLESLFKVATWAEVGSQRVSFEVKVAQNVDLAAVTALVAIAETFDDSTSLSRPEAQNK
ncbi:hypothetical protein H9P43_009290 [Blastocladiella emersonii ATCC 22665]|nr:hypothetical protein H9P43_009290 [Blastocladiella emersonii ATCC 22665]